MKLARRVSMPLMALVLSCLAGCDEDPTRPTAGFILVSVVDASGPPVPDVEIRVDPAGLSALTNARGVARFRVAPGGYFVDASLCCRGAGFIEYHLPVTVSAGGIEAVELRSCLFCE